MAISILVYDYVDDILERRGPYRADHIARIESFASDHGLVVAGATGDPPRGALFVFEDDSDPAGAAAEFAAGDPYVEAGLVIASRIEPWSVVAHSWK